MDGADGHFRSCVPGRDQHFIATCQPRVYVHSQSPVSTVTRLTICANCYTGAVGVSQQPTSLSQNNWIYVYEHFVQEP
jgi:hypothetical protein